MRRRSAERAVMRRVDIAEQVGRDDDETVEHHTQNDEGRGHVAQRAEQRIDHGPAVRDERDQAQHANDAQHAKGCQRSETRGDRDQRHCDVKHVPAVVQHRLAFDRDAQCHVQHQQAQQYGVGLAKPVCQRRTFRCLGHHAENDRVYEHHQPDAGTPERRGVEFPQLLHAAVLAIGGACGRTIPSVAVGNR
jgi:hypothetical protein